MHDLHTRKFFAYDSVETAFVACFMAYQLAMLVVFILQYRLVDPHLQKVQFWVQRIVMVDLVISITIDAIVVSNTLVDWQILICQFSRGGLCGVHIGLYTFLATKLVLSAEQFHSFKLPGCIRIAHLLVAVGIGIINFIFLALILTDKIDRYNAFLMNTIITTAFSASNTIWVVFTTTKVINALKSPFQSEGSQAATVKLKKARIAFPATVAVYIVIAYLILQGLGVLASFYPCAVSTSLAWYTWTGITRRYRSKSGRHANRSVKANSARKSKSKVRSTHSRGSANV